MTAKRAAPAASKVVCERQERAVLDGPSGRVMLGCCAASDGREEPKVHDAAPSANGSFDLCLRRRQEGQ